VTQHPKAEAARKAVERMEQERVMVHGIEVKPGQVWAFEGHSGDYPPSRVVSVDHAQRVIRIVDECATPEPEPDEWGVESFARVHPRLVNPDPGSEAPNDGGPDGAGSCPKPEEPSSDRGARWTDAEWAAEAVARARRQADAARAEARELRAELVEAHRAHRESCDASLPIEAERDKLRAIVESDRALAGEASEAWAVLTGRDWMEAGAAGSCVTEARRVVAERDKLRADLDHLRVGTIDHESGRDALSRRVDDLLAQLVTARAATDSVAKAHRAVGDELRAHRDQWRNLRVELGVPDGEGIAKHINWKLTQRAVALANAEERAERAADALAEAERDRDETRAALEAARAAVHTPSPGGSDPATRTRALPELDRCGECRHINRSTRDDGRGDSCGHPDGRKMSVERHRAPPECCPVAELAKAGGA